MLKKKTTSLCPNADTCTSRSCSKRMAFASVQKPEQIVGVGFRCWMAGYDTGDISCWETGWNHYARELGQHNARETVGALACWTRMTHLNSCRKISCYPYGSAGFSLDECVAISMIAASQHAACPAMRACAFALLGTNCIDGVVDAAQAFGHALSNADIRLDPNSIVAAAALSSELQCSRPN